MQHLTDAVIAFIHHFGYLGLFVAMTGGNIGAPVGSEVILPVAGALVATGVLHNLYAVVLGAVLGELTGGTIGYAVGRYGGRAAVHRFGHYVLFHEAEMAKVERFFARYGSFAIFICRFIPMIRGIVAIPAGIARMPLLPFYLWTALGSLIFCGVLVELGYGLGHNLDKVLPLLHRSSTVVIGLTVLVVAIAGYFTIVRRKKAAAPVR